MTKSKNKKGRKGPKRARAYVMAVSNSLDAAAAAYRRLLLDPCNGAMVQPTYAGISHGNYRRFRTFITVPATWTEGTYTFQLGTNTYCRAPSTTTSQNMNAGSEIFAGHYGSTDDIRCIAGCVKVRYTGAESSRAGVIGMVTGTTFYAPGKAVLSTEFALGYCPIIQRLGEVQHEAKFVPSTGDQETTSSTHYTTTDVVNWDESKSTIGLVFKGIPAGTLQIEITGILEAESFAYGVSSAVAPLSGNTLNQVLTSLGPVASWAYNSMVVPTIRSAATGVMRSIASSMSATAANTRLLTL